LVHGLFCYHIRICRSSLLRWAVCAWIGLQTVPALSAPALEQTALQRVALVIGNSQYKKGPLDNPANDATDMAAALALQGFRVFKVLDADKPKMRDAIRLFSEQLDAKSVAVFFYAGHGIQINGKNFLIPVDAAIKRAEDVEDQGLSLDWAMQGIDAKKPHFNIVILDACRNNPFARSYGSGGLAAVDAAAGSLIAFSTSPTKVASDGAGRNGLYTHHLLRHIATPGLKIEALFKRVRIGVMEQSAGEQVPWENTSLTADLILSPSPTDGISVSVDANTSPRPIDTVATVNPVTPAWIVGADLKTLKNYLATHPTEMARDPVVLAFARANARRALRAEAQKLSVKDCDHCPPIVDMVAMVQTAASHTPRSQGQWWMGMDLVTVREYQSCIADGACRSNVPSAVQPAIQSDLAAFLPVQNVSQSDALRYIDWLNHQTRAHIYRLPTQSEWASAFKSGYFLDSGQALAAHKNLCDIGNFYDISGAVVAAFPWPPNPCNDGFAGVSPVGAFLPSQDGLFDMVGNLWQWTSTCQDAASPPGTSCKKARLVGASWATAPRWNWQDPPQMTADTDLATDIFGIRVVAVLPP